MPDLLVIPFATLYLLVVGALFVYGVNFLYLTYVSGRRRHIADVVPANEPLPSVTVQLPIYNELYVAERLLEATARLDYPPERLEIQVLDDSTDQTTAILQQACERLEGRGIRVRLLHRTDRAGFKAGALAAGLASAEGEFLAIFDADFVPPPDFLHRTLPAFRNPRVAFVQTRWDYLNRDYSLLTRLQSLAIDAHFMVEQSARASGAFWFNFNGTAGVWRKSAILDSGGWKADTLTEDLDLSYRAFLGGWQAAYLPEVGVPAELPVSVSAYRRQQGRWARGSIECALKLLPRVWKAPVTRARKVQATLHLAGYGVHLLLFALAILYPIVVLLSMRHPLLVQLFGISAVLGVTGVAPTVFFVAAQRRLGRGWVRQLPAILFMTVLGSGMMLNTVRAAVQILQHKALVFERTPKFGITGEGQDWRQRRHYQMRLDPLVYAELALALWNAATLALALYAGDWGIALYAAIFGCGLVYVAGLTVAQSLSLRLEALRAAAVVPGDRSQAG